MPPRVTLLQMVERLIDRADFEDCRRLPHRDARVLARVDRRHRLEVRHERQRLALLEHDVLDVWRADRLEPALTQRLADDPRNQFVRHVVENLVLVRCRTTVAGTLPGRNPGTRADLL